MMLPIFSEDRKATTQRRLVEKEDGGGQGDRSDCCWSDSRMVKKSWRNFMSNRGKRKRCSVLLELHVVRWAHLHFSLAHICPVGAQDCTTWLHLRREDTEVEITSVEGSLISLVLYLCNTFSLLRNAQGLDKSTAASLSPSILMNTRNSFLIFISLLFQNKLKS